MALSQPVYGRPCISESPQGGFKQSLRHNKDLRFYGSGFTCVHHCEQSYWRDEPEVPVYMIESAASAEVTDLQIEYVDQVPHIRGTALYKPSLLVEATY
jgi:hypothetical protein